MASSSHFRVSGGSAKELAFLPLVFLPAFFFPLLFLGGAIFAATSSISIYARRVRRSTDGQVNAFKKAARPSQEVGGGCGRGVGTCSNNCRRLMGSMQENAKGGDGKRLCDSPHSPASSSAS